MLGATLNRRLNTFLLLSGGQLQLLAFVRAMLQVKEWVMDT